MYLIKNTEFVNFQMTKQPNSVSTLIKTFKTIINLKELKSIPYYFVKYLVKVKADAISN